MSYHQVNGYAPIFCYAGREGFMVTNELRPGTQHSEKGAVQFLMNQKGSQLLQYADVWTGQTVGFLVEICKKNDFLPKEGK